MQGLPTERLGQPITWVAERWPRLARALLWVPWMVAVAGLELLGRTSPADAVDGVGVALLATLLTSALTRYRERLLALWRGERVRRLLSPFHLRFGVDLRGTPPLPHRIPAAWGLLVCSVAVLLALLFWKSALFPTVARESVRTVSGLLWLTLLGGLWVFLGGATLFSWALVHGFLESRLQSRGLLSPASRQALRTSIGCGLVAALAGAVLLPLRWALVPLLGAGLLHATLTLPAGFGLRLVWRRADGVGEPAWGRLGLWNAGVVGGLVLLATIPILLGGGDRLLAPGPPQTAVTGLLARGFAWSAAAVAPVLLFMETWSLFAGWLADPARPCAPGVLLAGLEKGRLRRDASERLADAGFAVLYPGEEDGTPAARIEVDPEAGPQDPMAELFGKAWPLRLRPEALVDELGDTALHERLRRRAVVQSRRAVYRGVSRLWKLAAARSFQRGHGFWFAPHLWFVPGLTRDEDEGLAATIGPPYRLVFPRAARAHLREVLGGLEVDLLFVEDGVDFRRLRRVLSTLFEVHDLFGDRRLEDERHFTGLPGVRVILHDLQLDTPLMRTGYPEPDYDDLGRARVLHVFRDRGGEEDEVLTPTDHDTQPAPAAPLLLV